MSRLSRLFVGAVLVAGLATAARAADPDVLLPAKADTVVSVNVRQILDSDIAKKYALEQIKQTLDGKDIKKILAEIGLDPMKDVDQLVVGMSGSGKSDLKVLGILHGKFSPEKLFRTAEAQTKKDPDKFSQLKEGKTVIFKFQPDDGNPPWYFTVIDENTVVAGSEKALIVDAVEASGKQKSGVSKEVTALIKKMDEKASVYAVSVVKGKLDDVKIPGGGNLPVDLSAFQALLPKIETMAVSVQVKADVSLEVTLGMKDMTAADDFHTAFDDLIKQLKPLVQIFGAAEPRAKPLADVMNSVKSSAKSTDVVITGKVTGANIGKMMNPPADNDK